MSHSPPAQNHGKSSILPRTLPSFPLPTRVRRSLERALPFGFRTVSILMVNRARRREVVVAFRERFGDPPRGQSSLVGIVVSPEGLTVLLAKAVGILPPLSSLLGVSTPREARRLPKDVPLLSCLFGQPVIWLSSPGGGCRWPAVAEPPPSRPFSTEVPNPSSV